MLRPPIYMNKHDGCARAETLLSKISIGRYVRHAYLPYIPNSTMAAPENDVVITSSPLRRISTIMTCRCGSQR